MKLKKRNDTYVLSYGYITIMVILIFLNFQSIFCKENVKEIRFVNLYGNNNDLSGKDLEFKYNRKYLKDSIFYDSSFPSNKEIKFKIKNGEWYYYKNRKWQLFYSIKQTAKPYLHYKRWNLELKKIDTKEICGLKCEIYRLIPPLNTDLGDTSDYWFNPKYGVILISNGWAKLIREDIKYKYKCFIE